MENGPKNYRWFTYNLIAWVDFPWRTVSHNQMVIAKNMTSLLDGELATNRGLVG